MDIMLFNNRIIFIKTITLHNPIAEKIYLINSSKNMFTFILLENTYTFFARRQGSVA